MNDQYHIDRGSLQSRASEDDGSLADRNWTLRGILQTIFEFTLSYTFDNTVEPTFDNDQLAYFDKA